MVYAHDGRFLLAGWTKMRQIYFQIDDGVSLRLTLIDKALLTRRLEVQTSWTARKGRRIFYLFTAHDAFTQLHQPTTRGRASLLSTTLGTHAISEIWTRSGHQWCW